MITHRQLFFSNLAKTSPAPLALEIDKAEGIYLYDTSGKKYIDLISGISVSNVGHRHPKVVEAINAQLSKYMHLMVYGEYIQTPQVKLAETLTSLLPKKLDSVYLVNSGAEAVEGALKLAKRFTGRSEIIAYKNAYHGSTQGALSVMGNEEFKQAYRPLLPDIKFLNFNLTEELDKISAKTACVIIEPIQGEAGVISADNDFLQALRSKCDETKTLLIFDEIQTGVGRTGTMFAFEQYDVIPDILLLAKALGGGMPIGAFISSQKTMSSLSSNPVLGHITTFGGHPVCCASALAAIEAIEEENLIETVKEKEALFRTYLKHPAIKNIRSKGLLMAAEFENSEINMKVIKQCIEQGVITDWFLFNDYSMRIAPPLIITEEEIKHSCAIIISVLDNL